MDEIQKKHESNHSSRGMVNKEQEISNFEIAAMSIQQHSGPIPAPVILEEYDRICPGAADRIITMAENQAKHRQDLEKAVITSQVSNSKWGNCLCVRDWCSNDFGRSNNCCGWN